MLGATGLRLAVASAVMAGTVVAAPTAGSSAVCDTAPVVRAVTVTQGVGEYARLVRGKETLVRVAVSRPGCSSTATTLVATGTTATSLSGKATPTGGLPLGGSFTVARPFSPGADTAVPGWTDAVPAPGSEAAKAWPLFVVPGTSLNPSLPGDFTLDLTVTLAYRVGTGPVVTRSYAASPTRFTSTNPLSVLLVPMGNATNPGGLSAEYTPDDHGVVQRGMKTLSRAFPTPSGEGDLCNPATPSTPTVCASDVVGGIKWQTSPTMLNLGPSTPTDPGLDVVGAGQKFCGTGMLGNFPKVAAGLAATLSSWNARNPAGRADVVVGVVGERASYGTGNPPPAAQTCDEGRALVGGPVSWVRAVADRPATSKAAALPTPTGAYLSMELGHNLGLVPDTRDDDVDTTHSPEDSATTTIASADLGSGNAYNTTLRSWLADDRSAMKYMNSAWHNENVLYQPLDWAWGQCTLGATVDPSAAEQCKAPGSVGAAAAGTTTRYLRVSGRTDGTAAGTLVAESERGEGSPRGGDESSDFRFVQLVRRGTELSERFEQGFAVHRTDAHAHGAGHDDEDSCHDHCGVFEFALADRGAAPDGATRVYRLEHHGVVLAEWEDTPTNPAISTVEVAPLATSSPVNATGTAAADEHDPYVSPDGRVVAWSETAAGSTCPTVKVAVLRPDGSVATTADLATAAAASRPACPSLPSLRPDNGALAVTDQGSLWTVDMAVDLGDGAAPPSIAFTGFRRIFTCDLAGGPFCARLNDPTGLRGRVSRTAWERRADQPPEQMDLAFELNAADGLGDIYRTRPYALADGESLDATNSDPLRIGTAYQGEPSYSPDDGSLAFRQGTDEIRTVPVTAALPVLAADRLLCACGTLPWWGTPRHVAVADGGTVRALDLEGPGGNVGVALTNRAPDTAGNVDSRPAFVGGPGGYSGWRLWFDRVVEERRDVFRSSFGTGQVARVTGRDCDNREDVRAGIYLDTGSALLPLAVADRPTLDPVDACGVSFETTYQPSFLSPSASGLGPFVKVAANLNDGVDISGVVRGGDIEAPANAPVVSITAPTSILGDPGLAARVPFAATASSPTWGKLDGSAVQWFVRPPGAAGFGTTAVATGAQADAGPFTTPGVWGVRVTARDPDGRESSTTSSFVVCGTAAAVDFDPNTLFVPSQGTPVQVAVHLPCGIKASDISLTTGSVAVSDVDGIAYTLPAVAWNVLGPTTGQAKFDRATLSRFLSDNGFIGRYVPITVRTCSVAGCASGLVVSGRDPTAPFTNPA